MSDALRRKISALRQMTTAAGCTESEALAAAEMAAALMREHGLTEADITIGQASVGTATKGHSVRDALWGAVAYCTNTAPVFLHDVGVPGADLVFVGRDPGPEIASYLVSVLNRAINTAVAEFRASPFYRRRRSPASRRAAARDFTIGMVDRLSRRLHEIFRETIDAKARATAVGARDQRFAGARKVSVASAEVRNPYAMRSGWDAGSRVNLAHGVGGGADRLQIGRS